MMFRSLLEINNINLSEKDVKFVLALIDGEPNQCRCVTANRGYIISTNLSPDEKVFLFDIVANKRNGLDVDKYAAPPLLLYLLKRTIGLTTSHGTRI